MLGSSLGERSEPGLVNLETSRVGAAGRFRVVMDALARERRLSRMRRGVQAAAKLIEEMNEGGRYRPAMLTLTYAPDAKHRQKQVAELIQHHIKPWFERRGYRCRYVWVLELTKRGVPHYHLLLWIPRGERLPKPDRAGWWPYGMTQIQWARSAVGYLTKYASKGTDGELPKGARLFGCGGLTLAQRRTKAYRLLPKFVRDAFDIGDGVRREKGGGWVALATGEYLPGYTLVYDDEAGAIRFTRKLH